MLASECLFHSAVLLHWSRLKNVERQSHVADRRFVCMLGNWMSVVSYRERIRVITAPNPLRSIRLKRHVCISGLKSENQSINVEMMDVVVVGLAFVWRAVFCRLTTGNARSPMGALQACWWNTNCYNWREALHSCALYPRYISAHLLLVVWSILMRPVLAISPSEIYFRLSFHHRLYHRRSSVTSETCMIRAVYMSEWNWNQISLFVLVTELSRQYYNIIHRILQNVIITQQLKKDDDRTETSVLCIKVSKVILPCFELVHFKVKNLNSYRNSRKSPFMRELNWRWFEENIVKD